MKQQDSAITWHERADAPSCLAGRAYLELFQQTYPHRKPGDRHRAGRKPAPFMTRYVRQLLAETDYSPHRGDAVEIITDSDLILLAQLEQGVISEVEAPCLVAVRRQFFYERPQGAAISSTAPVLATAVPVHDLEVQASRQVVGLLTDNGLPCEYADDGACASFIPSPCWSCPVEDCRRASAADAPHTATLVAIPVRNLS